MAEKENRGLGGSRKSHVAEMFRFVTKLSNFPTNESLQTAIMSA